MKRSLLPYFAEELRQLREAGASLSRESPKLAARLGPGGGAASDPATERLLQGTALLAARLRQRLDEHEGDLARVLLEQVFPQLARPVPARCILRFDAPDVGAGAMDQAARRIEAGTALLGQPLSAAEAGELRGLACRFRTLAPVDVTGISIVEAKLATLAVAGAATLAAGADAQLTLRIKCPGRLGLAGLGLDRLRLHLGGDPGISRALYELLLGPACKASAMRAVTPATAVDWPREGQPLRLASVGFEPDEAMFPDLPQSLSGFRLLLEYFAFPEKLMFVDIALPEPAMQPQTEFAEIRIEFRCGERRRAVELLAQQVNEGHFVPNCAPAANLFSITAEPIQLTHESFDNPVVVDQRRPEGYEVLAVEQVTMVGGGGRLGRRELSPLFERNAPWATSGEDAPLHWTATQRLGEDGAAETRLAVIDPGLSGQTPTDAVLLPQVLACNGDVPIWQQPKPGIADFTVEALGALSAGVLGEMQPMLRAPHDGADRWRLIAHLAASRRSLVGGGAAGLRDVLSIYGFDQTQDPRVAIETVRQIEAIVDLSARMVTMQVGEPLRRAFVTGTEVELVLDEARLPAGTAFLFSAVLDRLFAGVAAANSFSRLVVRSRQRSEPVATCAPRIGLRPLL